MRSASRAASTTSGVTVSRSLIWRMRRTWLRRRSTRRKFPPVIRAMVAMATLAVNSSLPLASPSVCQRGG